MWKCGREKCRKAFVTSLQRGYQQENNALPASSCVCVCVCTRACESVCVYVDQLLNN